MTRHEGRRRRFVSLARLQPPPGSPPSLHAAARRARVRHALGGPLGEALVSLTVAGREVTLFFDDARWVRAAESQRSLVERRVAGALDRPGLSLFFRPAPGRR